jgi:hypothetical protein
MRIRTLGAIAGICLVPPNPGPLKKEFKKGTDTHGGFLHGVNCGGR